MIQLKKLTKTYQSLAGDVPALVHVDLHIQKGEFVVVIGKSGSGKTTLLNVIAGIDQPDSGEIIVNGTSIFPLKENELANWRGKNIGIVFQFYQLFPTLSALDNILFPMNLVNIIPKKERKSRAEGLLEQVGLADKIKKFPNELSGGEQQRVAIARALANDPPVLIADEPTGNLDSKTGEQVLQLFQKLNQEGKTMMMVTHAQLSENSFDKIIHIQDGQIEIPKMSL